MPLTPEQQKQLDAINAELAKRQAAGGTGGAGQAATPQPPPSPVPSIGDALKQGARQGVQNIPTPLGVTLGQIGAMGDAYSRVKSGINTFLNELGGGPPLLGNSIPERLQQVPEMVSQAAQKGVAAAQQTGTPETRVDIIQQHVTPDSPFLARAAAKVGDFLIDAGTDPLNVVLSGPAGKAMDEALSAAKTAAANKLLAIPPVANAVAKMRNLVQPVIDSAPGAAMQRFLDFLGQGPLPKARQQIFESYDQPVKAAQQDIADVLNGLDQHADQVMRDPVVRRGLETLASTTNQQPVLGFVRAALQAIQKPSGMGNYQLGRVLSNAQQNGLDGNVIHDAASKLFDIWHDAKNLIMQVTNGPLQNEDREFGKFVNSVLGEVPTQVNSPVGNYFIDGAPPSLHPSIVAEAHLRDLLQTLPQNHPYWFNPVGPNGPRPGWVSINSAHGPLGHLFGYQMPKSIYNVLENNLVEAALSPSRQVKANYTSDNDVVQAVARDSVRWFKRQDLGTLTSRIGHLAGNIGQQAQQWKNSGVDINPVRHVAMWNKAMGEAMRWETKNVVPQDIMQARRFSPSLMNSQLEHTLLVSPSPTTNNLPKIIGSGKMSVRLPEPKDAVARIFGQGKAGYAAQAANTAVGALNPSEWLARFLRVQERAARMVTYRGLRTKFSPEVSAALTEKAHFNYDDRGTILQWLDRFGFWIFNTFPVKATEKLFDTLANHPSKVARFYRLRDIALAGDDPSKDKNLPDYMRKSMFTFPIKGGHVNIARFSHLGDPIDTLYGAYKDHQEGAGLDIRKAASRALDKSLFAGAVSLIHGNKPFSYDDQGHDKLLDTGQPPNELNVMAARELAKNYVPAYLPGVPTLGIPGGRAYQAVQDSLQGKAESSGQEPRQLSDVLAQYGLRLREVKDKTGLQKTLDWGASKVLRGKPGEAAFNAALAKARSEPTPKELELAYEKLDPKDDPEGFKLDFRQFMGYLQKTITSTKVVNPQGKVVDQDRLDNLARTLVMFERKYKGRH